MACFRAWTDVEERFTHHRLGFRHWIWRGLDLCNLIKRVGQLLPGLGAQQQPAGRVCHAGHRFGFLIGQPETDHMGTDGNAFLGQLRGERAGIGL
ncbi:MAG: hypothetical protein ACK4P4_03675, partial [Allorhizobium sp.]